MIFGDIGGVDDFVDWFEVFVCCLNCSFNGFDVGDICVYYFYCVVGSFECFDMSDFVGCGIVVGVCVKLFLLLFVFGEGVVGE